MKIGTVPLEERPGVRDGTLGASAKGSARFPVLRAPGAYGAGPPGPRDRVVAPPLSRRIRELVRQPAFWVLQLGVVAVTGVHLTVELTGVGRGASAPVVVLTYLPLQLYYLVPVAYGGLRYGVEGAVAVGLEVVLLVVPNIALFHRDGFEWLGELTSLLVVVGVGAVLTVPVERERRERERAESQGRRLAFLNACAATLARGDDPVDSAPDVLDGLLELVFLDLVRLRIHRPGGRRDRVLVRGRASAITSGDPEELPGATVFPLRGEGTPLGDLVAVPASGGHLRAEERELLDAVAHHLALQLDAARLRCRERDGLRAYAGAVTWGQEDERKRIARELHDEAAQPLVHLARGLGRMADAPGVPAEVQRRSEDLRGVALRILQTVRDYSRHLRPTALDDLGLVPALERVARDAAARGGLALAFRVTGGPRRMAPDIETAAFRIVQEATRNVERHAGAACLSLLVEFTDERLRVTVEDDGRGFSMADGIEGLAIRGSLGLVGMQERAELVGGAVEVDSRLRAGTRVVAELPR